MQLDSSSFVRGFHFLRFELRQRLVDDTSMAVRLHKKRERWQKVGPLVGQQGKDPV